MSGSIKFAVDEQQAVLNGKLYDLVNITGPDDRGTFKCVIVPVTQPIHALAPLVSASLCSKAD